MRPYLILLLFRRIRNIKYLIKDKNVSMLKKMLIIFGIVYLISPIDLIPFPVLGFSIIDDLVLWGFILSYLKDELDKYTTNNKNDSFKGKKIIDSVEYEIKTNNKTERK